MAHQPQTKEQRDFKISGFYSSHHIIRENLLDSEARWRAEAFAKEKEKVSSTQLRRFYADVKQLHNKIEQFLWERREKEGEKGASFESTDPEDLKEYLPLIRMLKAKVAYARRSCTRDRVSSQFKETIDSCINLIRSPKDFHTFTLFFEAIVGYYYEAEARQSSQKQS